MRHTLLRCGTDHEAECTAKALTHRISKIRALAKTDPADGEGEQANGEKPKKSTKANKSGTAPEKNGKGGKKAAAECTPSPEGGDKNYLTPPDTNRAKRAGSKRNYAELEGETGSDGDGERENDGLDKENQDRSR